MCCFRFTMSASSRKAVECRMKTAQRRGQLRQVKYCLAILAVVEGQSVAQVALVLRVPRRPSQPGYVSFAVMGSRGHRTQSPRAAHRSSLQRRKQTSPLSLTRGQSRPVFAVPAGARL